MMTIDRNICFIPWLCIIILFFSASTAYSASESVFASYKYTMGDNDTKNDAKRICFIEAKRLAIEKAGTYIESSTEIKNFNLTRDEIRTFAGAIVKVEIASEEVKFIGENQVIFMTVKADVDIGSFRERVMQIKSDRGLEQKVIDQQRQLQRLEDNLKNLQQQLTTKNLDQVITLRKERVDTFGKIDELETIKFEIKTKTKAAIENIEIGMSRNDVLKILGPQRAGQSWSDLNYGNVWIVFDNDVVNVIVDVKCYQYAYRRGDYFKDINPCGAGRGIIKY